MTSSMYLASHRRPAIEILAGPAGRTACAERDVAAVYRLLGAAGYSQRQLAAMTGQSQSEISEILGGRLVVSVYVLERIADGLSCPRAWWRLAGSDDQDAEPLALTRRGASTSSDRQLCAATAQEICKTAKQLLTQANSLAALTLGGGHDPERGLPGDAADVP